MYSAEDRSSHSVTWCQLRWWGMSETRKDFSLSLIWRWQVLVVMTCLFPDFTPVIRPAVPCMDASIDCCQTEGPGGEHYPGRSETPRWPGEASLKHFSEQAMSRPVSFQLTLWKLTGKIRHVGKYTMKFQMNFDWASISVKHALHTLTLF